MILWITGISGSGKTTIGRYFYLKFKKKYKNTLFIDGDEFRALFSNDLKYTIKDRDRNAQRMTAFAKYISEQKINLIISANITSVKYRVWCKKNLKNFVQVNINAKIEQLIKRDYKNLYTRALKKKIKNVVGIDLPYKNPKKVDFYLENNDSKKNFLKKIKIIIEFLKRKRIKIY